LITIALLRHLDGTLPQGPQRWQNWQIAPVPGGANNLLYRATLDGGPTDSFGYAVKFTVRDDRRRAWREYAALNALHQAGIEIAPPPIWLDEHSYRQPVVVQSWLAGAVLDAPPQSDADWTALLHHYCAIHALTPAHTSIALDNAVLNASSGTAGKTLVQQHVDKLPPKERPDSLQRLLAWFEQWSPPVWPPAPRALCRVDANWRNFIRREGAWASVDWENSGWGDPACELADLMTHPAYADVPAARWTWLASAYANQQNDATAVIRIQTYYTILLVWWVVRWARYLYEVPRGLDPRLVSRPSDWRAVTEQKYLQYLARAELHIATLDQDV
jgi:aminoglycoside phosphotransferase (APT) family kinase protein